jgi:hypothetical protein
VKKPNALKRFIRINTIHGCSIRQVDLIVTT